MSRFRTQPTPLEVWQDRLHTILWRLISFAVWFLFVVGGFIALALWVEYGAANEQLAFNTAKAIITIGFLAVAGFGLYLFFVGFVLVKSPVHEQIYPTELVEKFPPRPAPANGDWQNWLERGIRIGRLVGPSARLLETAWQKIIDTHLLVAGWTRMGKSKFLANFMHELQPAIDAGAAEIHLFDPSNGMEFGWTVGAGLVKPENFHYGQGVGRRLPDTGEWDGLLYEETFLEPLEKLVEQMSQRTGELRFRTHSHVAVVHGPHRFVIIDEGSTIASKHVPSRTRDRINAAVASLTNMGAKAGYTVVVATQYPAVDEIAFRRGLLAGVCLAVKSYDMACKVLQRQGLHPERWRDARGNGIRGIALTTSYGGQMIRLVNTRVEFPADRPPGSRVDPAVVERVPAPKDYVEPEMSPSNVFPIYPDRAA